MYNKPKTEKQWIHRQEMDVREIHRRNRSPKNSKLDSGGISREEYRDITKARKPKET